MIFLFFYCSYRDQPQLIRLPIEPRGGLHVCEAIRERA